MDSIYAPGRLPYLGDKPTPRDIKRPLPSVWRVLRSFDRVLEGDSGGVIAVRRELCDKLRHTPAPEIGKATPRTEIRSKTPLESTGVVNQYHLPSKLLERARGAEIGGFRLV